MAGSTVQQRLTNRQRALLQRLLRAPGPLTTAELAEGICTPTNVHAALERLLKRGVLVRTGGQPRIGPGGRPPAWWSVAAGAERTVKALINGFDPAPSGSREQGVLPAPRSITRSGRIDGVPAWLGGRSAQAIADDFRAGVLR